MVAPVTAPPTEQETELYCSTTISYLYRRRNEDFDKNSPKLVPSPEAAFSSNTSKEATDLLTWKDSLQNDSQSHLSSWNPSVSSSNLNPSRNPCNNWLGISCNPAGSVVKIDLGNSSLQELTSGDIVAVKTFNRPLHDAGENRFQKEFLNEIRALIDIRHRNIVKLYGFCSHVQHSFLVYQYLERGSLSLILGNEDTAKVLGWSKRLNIVKGVAYALSYMHHDCSPLIIHHDITSSNILLDSQFEAHVSDFGTAKLLELDSSNWTSLAGTYGYIAPVYKLFHCPIKEKQAYVLIFFHLSSIYFLCRACLYNEGNREM
ncbi:probable leucine-rich repeat receptor-like protein kinase At1g35710 [Juglans microcarpa x Juglans regia]|uniref:probable leucine-rich repeat receptor-like protein kinase At1g35710 n=1 Tax=Juglans microcarpa x Juglans regia TaxID=2249226 RepID=UPI001B7ED3F8|nr:probable leucine-rich repeat receptor-like protein kinase At1g35710 [Juglans microcarpa x Juglans regia]